MYQLTNEEWKQPGNRKRQKSADIFNFNENQTHKKGQEEKWERTGKNTLSRLLSQDTNLTWRQDITQVQLRWRRLTFPLIN